MRPVEHGGGRRLQARLESALGEADTACTVVAYGARGHRALAAVGVGSAPADQTLFRTGCATKLLVAALLERRLGAHGLHWHSPLQDVLGEWSAAVAGVTIQHLLEHTHGLDDSHVAAPVREDGRIDVERLLARLAGMRRAAPGARYSYSNVGAFLIAAALESLEGRSLAAQLRDDLFAPLGVRMSAARDAAGASCRAQAVCPATGGGLRLAVGGLSAFLDACKARPPLVSAGGVERCCGAPTPLPGWHPVERGVLLGWKAYGGGWFGHQSTWPDASLLLCVRPTDGASLVVASASHPALVVAAKVLGRELPELLAPSLRRRAPASAVRPDPASYRGKYALAAEHLEVVARAGALSLRGPRGAARLVAAGGELFWLERSEPGRAFVQFIDRGDDGLFSSLWDGRRVYPRVAV